MLNQQIITFLASILPVLGLKIKGTWYNRAAAIFALELHDVLKKMHIPSEIVVFFPHKISTSKAFLDALNRYAREGNELFLKDFVPGHIAIAIAGSTFDAEGELQFGGYQCSVGMTAEQLAKLIHDTPTWAYVADVAYVPSTRKLLSQLPDIYDNWKEQFTPDRGQKVYQLKVAEKIFPKQFFHTMLQVPKTA